MCLMCAANPIAAFDGTHEKVAAYLEKASSAVGVDETITLDAEVGEISVGGTISGSIEAGGADLYRLDLTDGETVAIDLSGFGIDTVVSLYDADGNLIGTNDDVALGFDTDSRLTFTAVDTDAYYIKIESFNSDAQGDYSLQIETTNASGAATLQVLADQLTTGYWSTPHKWNLSDTGYMARDGVLTYNISGNSEDGNGLTSARKDLVREAFKMYEAVLGIDFQETNANDADFRFSDNKAGAYAGSSYGIVGGMGYHSYSIVNVEKGWYGSSSAYDGYTYQTILHEIGHAMGLGHQGDYNGSASYSRDAKYANDSWQGSMMSYFSQNGNTTIDASYAFLLSPMAADWVALNDMYGQYGYSTANAFAGDTVWGFNTTITNDVSKAWANLSSYADNMAFTIVDGGGTDTVDFSGYAYDQRIDLTVTEGSFTQATTSDIGNETGNMTLAVGTVIENAIAGSGNDVLVGNDVNNTLDGGAGDDSLTGGAGDDDLVGGQGTDAAVFTGSYADYTFTAGNGYWQVEGEGADRVYDSIENLVFADQVVAYGDIEASGGGGGVIADVASDPDARDDVLSVAEDGTMTADLFADNGSGADTHSEGAAFVITAVGDAGPGTVTLMNGAEYTVDADGSITFATNGAYNALAAGEGATVNVVYTITSTDAGTDTATATIYIKGSNDGPLAADDTFSVTEGALLTGNVLSDNGAGSDSDVDTSDKLVVSSVNNGAVGVMGLASGASLSLGADGAFSYFQGNAFANLNDGESAVDTFSYAVSDGNGGTSTATVSIVVNGVGSPDPAPQPGEGDGDTGGTMEGTELADDITGTDGEDHIVGRGGRDVLSGGGNNDTIDGGEDRDKIDGGDGDDNLYGGSDSDMLLGGHGNDVLDGGEGNDRLIGGDGNDDLTGGAGRDRLVGDAGSDTLEGGEDNDNLDGGSDNDVLFGGLGRDALRGGDGDDSLFGGEGNDRLNGDAGQDMLSGGDGDDQLGGRDGDDSMFGGDGNDRFSGGDGADSMFGGDGNDRFNGGNDNDSLFGGAGDDRIGGGNGDDFLVGGAGADQLIGQGGFDTVSYADETAAISVSFDREAVNGGAAEGDVLRQIEAVIATDYDDVLAGDQFDNQFTGGSGADRFVFELGRRGFGIDTITDFEDGVDVLDLSADNLSFEDFSISENQGTTVLTLTSDNDSQIILEGVTADQIGADDFV